MLILLRSGLANRLRTVVGFLVVAKLTGASVKFHWIADEACNGNWSEIFERISCIEEKSSEDGPYDFTGQNIVPRIVEQWVPEELRPGRNQLAKLELQEYGRFRIKPAIINRIRRLLPMNAFYAMHVRRTDHVRLAKSVGKYMELEEFEKFAAKAYENQCSLYLATDCPDVQQHFVSAFYNRRLQRTSELRPTSLADSMIDVLMCAHAVVFKGTPYSSFSELIDIYRRLDIRAALQK